jgi:hypothetical protein
MRFGVSALLMGIVRTMRRHVMDNARGPGRRCGLVDRKTAVHRARVQLRGLDHTDGEPER